MRQFLEVLVLAIGLVLPGTSIADERIEPGTGRFVYGDGIGKEARQIGVYYHRPAHWKPDGDRILVVMHGAGRNGETYRDAWIAAAEEHRTLLLVPEFDKEQFRRSADYQQGGMFNAPSGEAKAQSAWTFAILGRLFEDARRRTGAACKTFLLYGHSGGGQFVHRYMMFTGGDRVERAVAANAGWYTMPDFTIDFPYGLRASPATKENLRAAFSKHLILLLGEDDVKTTGNLRRTTEADRQGPHRFARGRRFYADSYSMAAKMSAPFAWRVESVPGVGHSNAGMAPAAARVLFE